MILPVLPLMPLMPVFPALRRLAARTAGVLALAVLSAPSAWAQPAPLRGLALVDHRQKPLRAESLARKPVLLNFIFAGCSTICPPQVKELAMLYDELPADVRSRVRFVSVTVDPVSDTPQALAAFVKRMDAERSGWAFVTGKPAVVEGLLDAMSMFPPGAAQKRPEDHRTSLYLYGADGNLVQRYRGMPVDRKRLLAEITSLVTLPAR